MRKIASAVESVGNKTIKQCKTKIDKLKKNKYKTAKDLNEETAGKFNTSPFYKTFHVYSRRQA